jgi:hypothetical protein
MPSAKRMGASLEAFVKDYDPYLLLCPPKAQASRVNLIATRYKYLSLGSAPVTKNLSLYASLLCYYNRAYEVGEELGGQRPSRLAQKLVEQQLDSVVSGQGGY